MVTVNEIIDLMKKFRKDRLIHKMNFNKACVSISLSFFDYIMERFGFCVNWRSWIGACVIGGNLSILVNSV